MSRLRGWRRAWDRVTLYLPILLMGVLALGTYWLSRSTPAAAPAQQQRAPDHQPDYYMRGFSVKTFDPTGRLKTEVQGTEARHFVDTDTTEIAQVRIRSYNEKGALTVATAKRAISNGDGSQVQLIGDAVVTREGTDAQGAPLPPLQIRGEFLHAFMNEERVTSNKPVTLVRGRDVFQGDSLDYGNLDRVLDMQGRVRGVLQPKEGAK